MPSTVTSPPSAMRKPLNAPSAPKRSVAAARLTRLVLMKPQPSQVMPVGLAITSAARWPKISIGPASVVRTPPVTSLRISDADRPSLRFGLAIRKPPIALLPVVGLLAKIRPSLPTDIRVKTLYEVPLASGVAMLTIGVPPGVTSSPVRLLAGCSGGVATDALVCARAGDSAEVASAARISVRRAPRRARAGAVRTVIVFTAGS